MLYEKETTPAWGLPLTILSLTLAGALGLQTWMLSVDRGVYTEAYAKQEEALANVKKAEAQTNNLVKGVMSLAKQDNKNAETIINELKKAGVNFHDAPAPKQAAAPVEPAAKK